jgi:transcriptional regulator with XRE-family HTH domain
MADSKPDATGRPTRRTRQVEARAEARAAYLARRLGVALREARQAAGLRQRDVAERIGLSQPEISALERGKGHGASILTWSLVASGVDEQLAAFLESVPGADRPRDYQHLRRQQLLIERARPGGWIAHPELLLDPDSHRSRSVDVALVRAARHEAVVAEVWDFFDDVGSSKRSLDGKRATLERQITTTRRVADAAEWCVRGLWVVRGTARNRRLVQEFAALFDAAFPAPPAAWLRCLDDPAASMPSGDGLLWTDIPGTRLLARRSSQASRR